MAAQHDWHVLDAEDGTEVRQLTDDGEEDRWEVRFPDGHTDVLDGHAFDLLRGGGE
jgi:hypothetical protein